MRDFSSFLITGGSGFIGSYLIEKLLETAGVESITSIDTCDPPLGSPQFMKIVHDPRLTFIKGNINDTEFLKKLSLKFEFTGIFHLAAEIPPLAPQTGTSEMIMSNVIGTSHLIELAKAAQIPLLHCSSYEVYGAMPFPEKYSESLPLNPRTPYSASKASADFLVQAAYETTQQDIMVARLTNIYGPHQDRSRLIPNAIYHARDWMHVKDCVSGLISIYKNGRPGRIFNLGANTEHTDLGIVRAVLKELHKPTDLIVCEDQTLGQDPRYALDVRRALQLLKWKARIPFRSGFPETVRELAASLRP